MITIRIDNTLEKSKYANISNFFTNHLIIVGSVQKYSYLHGMVVKEYPNEKIC